MEPLHTSNSPTQDDLAMTVQVEDSSQYLESPSVCFTASDTTLSPCSKRSFKDSTRSFKFSTRRSKDSTRRSKFSTGSLSKKLGRHNSAKASSLKWTVVNVAIQAAGPITAIVFGVWAVRTYGVARNSLDKADVANNHTGRSVEMANTANNLTKQALDIADFGNDLSLLALDIAQDANNQAREIADIMINLTETSHAIARAANHQARKIARTSHRLTRQALAIALDAKKQAGEIANTTNDLTRTSLAIANASNHQALAQNRLANSLQLLSFCGTMPHNLVSLYLPHTVRSGSTLYMCLFYMLLRNQTAQCASITLHLWAFVTNSVIPTTPTPTTTSSGIALIISAVNNAVHNLSTSTSSTPPSTTTTMSPSSGFQLIVGQVDGQSITALTSPTRPSPSTSPTSMRPAASTQQITAVRPSVSTPPTPPSTAVRPSPILVSHRRKKTMQLSVIIGIVVAVVVFFVAVGALIARRKGYISRCG
jgi:hypothetical protein